MEELTIIIKSDGSTTIQVEGVTGPNCVELTKDIEKALGKVTKQELTADYHKQPKLLTTRKN